MKSRLFAAVLLAVLVGFSACRKKKEDTPKSAECEILLFKVGDIEYQKEGLNISKIYTKTGTGEWSDAPAGAVQPFIEISAKADIVPKASVAQDFFKDGGVIYTVTAEDGKTSKTYTVKATKAPVME
jgi:hypothetical protein